MSKEEIENLKAELKEELKKELLNKKNKGTTYWNEYSKSLVKKLRNKGYTPHKAITSLTYFARAITGVNTVINLTQEDIEKVKPIIDEIINIIPNLNEEVI